MSHYITLYKYGKRTSYVFNILGAFLFLFYFRFLYFGAFFFNKAIIPHPLVENEMNKALTYAYATHARGIIILLILWTITKRFENI